MLQFKRRLGEVFKVVGIQQSMLILWILCIISIGSNLYALAPTVDTVPYHLVNFYRDGSSSPIPGFDLSDNDTNFVANASDGKTVQLRKTPTRAWYGSNLNISRAGAQPSRHGTALYAIIGGVNIIDSIIERAKTDQHFSLKVAYEGTTATQIIPLKTNCDFSNYFSPSYTYSTTRYKTANWYCPGQPFFIYLDDLLYNSPEKDNDLIVTKIIGQTSAERPTSPNSIPLGNYVMIDSEQNRQMNLLKIPLDSLFFQYPISNITLACSLSNYTYRARINVNNVHCSNRCNHPDQPPVVWDTVGVDTTRCSYCGLATLRPAISFAALSIATDYTIPGITYYAQGKRTSDGQLESWADSKINGKKTMSNSGCTITACSMLLRKMGILDPVTGGSVTPASLLDWLNNALDTNNVPKYFSPPLSSNVILSGIVAFAKESRDLHPLQPLLVLSDLHCTNPDTIEQKLSEQIPIVLRVKSQNSGNTHFVLATGVGTAKSTLDSTLHGTYYIADPAGGVQATIMKYLKKGGTQVSQQNLPNRFTDAVIFKPSYETNVNLGWFSADVACPVDMLITDALGRRLGKDSLGNEYNEIPGGSYNLSEEVDNDEDTSGTYVAASDSGKSALIRCPLNSTYKVQVIGRGTGSYSLHLANENSSLTNSQSGSYSGDITTNEIKSYLVPVMGREPLQVLMQMVTKTNIDSICQAICWCYNPNNSSIINAGTLEGKKEKYTEFAPGYNYCPMTFSKAASWNLDNSTVSAVASDTCSFHVIVDQAGVLHSSNKQYDYWTVDSARAFSIGLSAQVGRFAGSPVELWVTSRPDTASSPTLCYTQSRGWYGISENVKITPAYKGNLISISPPFNIFIGKLPAGRYLVTFGIDPVQDDIYKPCYESVAYITVR